MINAFLTIKHGLEELGTLHLELYDEVVPKTVRNFAELIKGYKKPNGTILTYRNSIGHRLISGFMGQFGDFTEGDGTGGESIYGPSFDDENFVLKHETKGILSMANSGPNTNGSQFFITFRKTPHLDNKHVVFGKVDLQKSGYVLRELEKVKTDNTDRPLKPVIVVDCGVVEEDPQAAEVEVPSQPAGAHESRDEEVVEEEEEEEDTSNLTKSQAIKNRLRKLKMKMNQARTLNHKALQAEGEAMLNDGGKAGKGQSKKGKKMNPEKASLVESAQSSMERAERRAEKKETGEFSVRDYVNIEGQTRHYERNVRNIPRHLSEQATDSSRTETYDAMMDSTDTEKERAGARRLANEMHRRIEKQSKRKHKLEFDETDVTYINQRNKRFNQKINRNYDQATAEIKQNLERGTAL